MIKFYWSQQKSLQFTLKTSQVRKYLINKNYKFPANRRIFHHAELVNKKINNWKSAQTGDDL